MKLFAERIIAYNEILLTSFPASIMVKRKKAKAKKTKKASAKRKTATKRKTKKRK
jgi:hypothetical protein